MTILQETYPKGVHVFGSNDITERKKRLRAALADSGLFPYTKGEDSSFTIFATMTIKAAGTQPEATLQFEPGFEDLKSAPGLTRDLFEMLFQLLSASRVWEFIEESGCDYTLGVDYYPNRKVNQEGAGYHKDSYLYTTFILLAYLNEAPLWGPEWLLDLALTDDDRLRWYEKHLPEPIAAAIAEIRKNWSELKVVSKNKTAQEWLSYARSRLLQPYANVSFFDPLITHTSPYLDERTFPGQRTSINQDFDGKRKPEKFSTISQPTRKIDRIESGARGKVERRLRWQGAKDVTFKDDRAFMRVEVRADGGKRVRATYG
ncbi:hypothetical protein [Sorangium sp. So ce854]|uniref:hypothetical protein n=1 Tax=Sorangium sp. So ce854 TaxID=3133322 RepID=UPI003F5F7EB6